MPQFTLKNCAVFFLLVALGLTSIKVYHSWYSHIITIRNESSEKIPRIQLRLCGQVIEIIDFIPQTEQSYSFLGNGGESALDVTVERSNGEIFSQREGYTYSGMPGQRFDVKVKVDAKHVQITQSFRGAKKKAKE